MRRNRTGPLIAALDKERFSNSGHKMSSAHAGGSPGNFSNFERQQQLALLGVTGSTLSQHMHDNNVKKGNNKDIIQKST